MRAPVAESPQNLSGVVVTVIESVLSTTTQPTAALFTGPPINIPAHAESSHSTPPCGYFVASSSGGHAGSPRPGCECLGRQCRTSEPGRSNEDLNCATIEAAYLSSSHYLQASDYMGGKCPKPYHWGVLEWWYVRLCHCIPHSVHSWNPLRFCIAIFSVLKPRTACSSQHQNVVCLTFHVSLLEWNSSFDLGHCEYVNK